MGTERVDLLKSSSVGAETGVMRWVWRLLRFVLPEQCEVCRGRQAVQMRFSEGARSLRHLSIVIPCPHCTHDGELRAHLPGGRSAPLDGGDAA
jgi:hypothetical protein